MVVIMLGKKYLIHDRDPLFNKRFDSVFESISIEIKKLPPFMPQMNARMENFIRAIKTECLDKIIFTSERQLRLAVMEYLEYWNHYRPHAGLGGKMVKPYPQAMNAPVSEYSFISDFESRTSGKSRNHTADHSAVMVQSAADASNLRQKKNGGTPAFIQQL